MSSIIDLIYYSDYFRTTDNSSFGDEYKSAIEKVCKAEKQLLNKIRQSAILFVCFLCSVAEHYTEEKIEHLAT